MGRSSEWGLAIRRILSDGEWHDRETLVREAMRTVPPGRAFRAAEKGRSRYHDGVVTPRKRGNDETAIAAGQRMLVTAVLVSQIRVGHYEQRTEANGKQSLRDKRVFDQLVAERDAIQAERDDAQAELLDLLERQLGYWQNAFKFLGSNRAVREAIIGGDPIAELERILEHHNRNVGEHGEDAVDEV